jgi:hypothetical protein
MLDSLRLGRCESPRLPQEAGQYETPGPLGRDANGAAVARETMLDP